MAVALLSTPVQVLTVRPARGSGLLWAAPVKAGSSEFQLRWIHTITRGPVAETYMIEPDGRVRLVRMVFNQFGANLPASPEPGTTWQAGPDGITVTGYTERHERLNLGVGPYEHRLIVGSRELDLIANVGADRLIRISVERQPWIRIYLMEVFQWRSSLSPF